MSNCIYNIIYVLTLSTLTIISPHVKSIFVQFRIYPTWLNSVWERKISHLYNHITQINKKSDVFVHKKRQHISWKMGDKNRKELNRINIFCWQEMWSLRLILSQIALNMHLQEYNVRQIPKNCCQKLFYFLLYEVYKNHSSLVKNICYFRYSILLLLSN